MSDNDYKLDDGDEVTFVLHDIQNAFKSHELLCKLGVFLRNNKGKTIIIDFSKTSFVASNLFAVIGCLIMENCRGQKVLFREVNKIITQTVQKNGFCKEHNLLTPSPDMFHTVIPYKIFRVNEIDEYERYLKITLFARKDLPNMSAGVTDSIIDYLLELFKNVCDHTKCEKIYTCGHYFPKSSFLYFTVADGGETIADKVKEYHEKRQIDCPSNTLQWALELGNTTSLSSAPRGLGLHLIKQFVHMNEGQLFIFSGKEAFEVSRGKERFKDFENCFPGTVVTLAFNMNDKQVYHLENEEDVAIEF